MEATVVFGKHCPAAGIVEQGLDDLADKQKEGLFPRADALLDPWFCSEDKNFYVRVGENYIAENVDEFSVTVRSSTGGAIWQTKAGGNSYLQEYMKHVRHNRRVVLALELAGRRSGILPESSPEKRILVSKSPNYLTPVKGEWPNLKKYIELFMDEAQRPYFMAWHAQSFRDTYSFKWSASKILVLAGGSGSGKTFWQTQVLSRIWGGSANPYRYFSGQSSFNGQFSKAVHLQMSDVGAKGTRKQRIDLGANIKHWVSDPYKEVHKKGEEEFVVPLIQRVTLSTNLDVDSISVLPPLVAEATRDKFMLLKCGTAALPANFGLDPYDEAGMQDLLVSEIPAFLHYMLNEYEIEPQCRATRGNIKNKINEELEAMIEDLESPSGLLDILDGAYFQVEGAEAKIEKSSAQIHAEMMSNITYSRAYSRIAWDVQKLGTLLGELEARTPREGEEKRVTSRGAQGKKKIWTIKRDSTES